MDSTLQTIRKLAEKNANLQKEVDTRRIVMKRLKNRLLHGERYEGGDFLRKTSMHTNMLRSFAILRNELNHTRSRLESFLSENETAASKAAATILSRMVAEKMISQEESHTAIRAVLENRLRMEDFILEMVDRPRKLFHPSQGASYRKRCDLSLMELRVTVWTYSQLEELEEMIDQPMKELQSRLQVCTLTSIDIKSEDTTYG